MIKLEQTERIKKYADKTMAEYETRLSQVEEALNKTNEAIAKVDDQVNGSYAVENVQKYHKDKKELAALKDDRAIYLEALKNLNDEPVIGKAQYENFIDEIKEEVKKHEVEARTKLIALAEQSEAIGKELDEAVQQANEVMTYLHDTLYKSKDILMRGGFQIGQGLEKYDARLTILLANAGTKTRAYELEKEIAKPSEFNRPHEEKLTNL